MLVLVLVLLLLLLLTVTMRWPMRMLAGPARLSTSPPNMAPSCAVTAATVTSARLDTLSSSQWNGSKAALMSPRSVEMRAMRITPIASPMNEIATNLTATVLSMVSVVRTSPKNCGRGRGVSKAAGVAVEALWQGLGAAHDVVLCESLAQLVGASVAAADDAESKITFRLSAQARQHPVGGRVVVAHVCNALRQLGRYFDCGRSGATGWAIISVVWAWRAALCLSVSLEEGIASQRRCSWGARVHAAGFVQVCEVWVSLRGGQRPNAWDSHFDLRTKGRWYFGVPDCLPVCLSLSVNGPVGEELCRRWQCGRYCNTVLYKLLDE